MCGRFSRGPRSKLSRQPEMLFELANYGVKTSSSFCPYVELQIGKNRHKALVDSGSARCLVSKKFFNVLVAEGLVRGTEATTLQCLTASNEIIGVDMIASIHFKIEGFSWTWRFLVSGALGSDCILGADFVAGSGLVLDLKDRVGFFKFRRGVRVPLFDFRHEILDEVLEITCPPEEPREDPFAHLSTEHREQLSQLCRRFPEVLTKQLGLTSLMEYKIKLLSSQVERSHPYKLAPPKMEILRKTVDELLEQGVIEPSRSSYASPAFLVPKAGGKSRMVIDYRKVNAHIDVEAVPLPDLHSAFDWFGRARYFTVFDLNAAYHQIPLAPESRDITSFCVPWNLYRFRRVPMGLAVGAQTLTRLLDLIFHNVKFKYVYNYLDDLLVFSEDWDSHMLHLEEVMKRLKEAQLTVNPDKVKFARNEISFLGHLVSAKGIKIDPARTQGIRDFPPPRDVKGIARFVGMANFYRKFIPNVAELAAPLNKLRQKGASFVWGNEQQLAFESLKEAIMSPPVLRMPDFTKPFILQTDASSVAIGAVLSQEVDGTRQPVAFASRTLSPSEKKASTVYELECLAVVFGMDKFRQYLEHSEFLLETDNQALSWLLAHPRQLGKIGRWVVKISSFKFRTQHLRGSLNVVADTLSRMYSEPNDDPEEILPVSSLLLQFPLAFTDVAAHQLCDVELGPILRELLNGGTHPPYFLTKGALCCRPQRGNRSPKLVLPSALVPMVFEFFHSSPAGGHVGILKTIGKIRQHFIWKGMDREIAGRVRTCRLCALSKPAQNTQLGLLASEVAHQTMEKVFIDFVGPFPRSKQGNTMLLVCVDSFSKFVWMLPLRRATANTAVQALKSAIFQHFGFPKILVSDNGSQFTSHIFRRMCFGHGIRHVTTSPYYPQPSHAERFNRNLRSSLIAFHAQQQNTWDENLRWLQLSFNSALHESHKDTPFKVMFGHSPRDPLSNQWKIEDLLPDVPDVDFPTIWENARQNLLRSWERVRRRYNKGRVPNPFRAGDLVFCRSHPQSSAVDKIAAKLCYRWTGPHRIDSFLSPVTARLVHPETGELFRKAHVSHLKPSFVDSSETSRDDEELEF